MVAATFLACGAAEAEAPASPADDVPRVVVRYADLDITHEAGAQILRRRIDAATAQVCGGAADRRLLDRTASFGRCRNTVLARIMTDLDTLILLAQADVAPGR